MQAQTVSKIFDSLGLAAASDSSAVAQYRAKLTGMHRSTAEPDTGDLSLQGALASDSRKSYAASETGAA